MKNTDYLEQIVERLKKTDPYKIILFGSHAYGDAQKDSDIDLIVVLNNNIMPKTFKEKMRYQLLVRNAILDINKEIPTLRSQAYSDFFGNTIKNKHYYE